MGNWMRELEQVVQKPREEVLQQTPEELRRETAASSNAEEGTAVSPPTEEGATAVKQKSEKPGNMATEHRRPVETREIPTREESGAFVNGFHSDSYFFLPHNFSLAP